MVPTAEFLARHDAFEDAALAQAVGRGLRLEGVVALAAQGGFDLASFSAHDLDDALALVDRQLADDPSECIAADLARAREALVAAGAE